MRGPRTEALRRSLHLSIDPTPSPYRYYHPSVSDDSIVSPISSTRASIATTGTSASSAGDEDEWRLFSVLCLFDFVSDDPDHLQFSKNEILDVVKQEDTGWWAALRRNGSRVGWIPSAFVQPLSDDMAETLGNVGDELREWESDLERRRDSTSTVSTFNGDSYSYRQSRSSADWAPVLEEEESSGHLVSPTGLMPPERNLPPKLTIDPPSYLESERVYSPREQRFPHSPATPMPPNPSPLNPHPSGSTLRTPPLAIGKGPLTPVSPAHAHGGGELFRRNSELGTSSSGGRSMRWRPTPPADEPSSPSLRRLGSVTEASTSAGLGLRQPSIPPPGPVKAPKPNKVRQLTGDDDAQKFVDARVAEANTPWYLRPVCGDDEIRVDFEGNIKAGTLRALVERLTLLPPTLSQGTAFQNVFLTTFRTFASADDVFTLLVERYEMDHPEALTSEQFEEWKTKKLRPAQQRVLTVLTMWLEDYQMLHEDPQIARRLQEFLALIIAPQQMAITAKLMLESLERLTFAAPSPATPIMSPARRAKKTKVHKNDLVRMDPMTVAQQLTVIEFKLYVKIRPQECLSWAKTQTGKTVANLAAFCATHDRLASWVKLSILSNEGLGKRADTVDFWIKVAEKCRSLNNFSSMSAIVAGLASTVISRLHLTWAHVSRTSHLEPLVKLNEPTGNFSAYRTLLQSIDAPCIPFVGMYLTDIVHNNDQYPDEIVSETGLPLVHFVKRQKWFDALTAILRYQAKQFVLVEEAATHNFVEQQLQNAAAKDTAAFWSRSQELQQAELAHADIRKGLEAAGF